MRYWSPLYTEQVMDLCGDARLVVDVGSRPNRKFPKATQTVGWEGDLKIDLESEPLPYEDQEVDFLYCRHTIEDLANPGHLLKEIQRVAKRGYIETPSPLAETTRGVDAGGLHLGYRHHRWVCGVIDSVFVCLAKYPIIERLPLRDHWQSLQEDRDLWNTCHVFEDLKFQVFQNERGFGMDQLCPERLVPIDYLSAINELVDSFTKQTVDYEPETLSR